MSRDGVDRTEGASGAAGRPPAAQRWLLWGSLSALVATLLVTLIWLAGRYEASQVQSKLERDAGEALSDIRSALTRNVQSLQALQAGTPKVAAWGAEAQRLLHERRELLRIEWRDAQLATLAGVDTPYRVPAFDRFGRAAAQPEVALACANARRSSGAGYAASYFVPQSDGLGLEVMDLCLPQVTGGQLTGYVVATYSLAEMLSNMVGPQLTRSQEVSFTEADGTRLALHGVARRGSRVFTAQQLLDLPGNTMVLRMDSWRGAPELFPNVLTALVTAMSIALLAVLFLLGKDTRRRLEVERDLADALAFRKAMEDSLVTGLRARDLRGRTTYVNPAFCEMVGFSVEELLGQGTPAPYWPPELVGEYQKRQEIRLAGRHAPPREGFESMFMRKDGSRFPVLIIEAPLINAQGVQTGWMSAFLDISEQRRVEELSRASQERLQATARLATVGEMASLLSHELNQPLAAISSYATGSLNLLDGRDAAPADLQVALRRIAEQAERAGRVIKSVHDFVRRRDKAREPTAPQALVDAVMPLVGLQARKLGVQVETRVAAGLPAVLCDRTMVEQVLLNLARNAMQAMDQAKVPRPSLVIQVRRTDGEPAASAAWLEFSVADCGPGIPAEVREQLFTPFFTTKAEGMGLGLSLCRTVVEQHGGFLAFEPNRPQGTIFRFTLPTQAAGVVQAPAPRPVSLLT
ncbi:MAG TPA: ATP-binding protein [Ramlibacter sp.]|jgi:two-component system sensor histidine kinase DctS|uniref:ATP-binding protein n=1 Tax=Ramlibacter sp. TaxID=1917967 RepID=UPI002D6B1029|nr:ATP-binding protein [Ramlibacter sp.]HZY17114.1 ATP-binding protein [Ramlibacter sp.]